MTRKRTTSLILFLIAFASLFSSCKKSTPNCEAGEPNVPASEANELATYLSALKIEAEKDPRGFFYEVIKTGSSTRPTVCSEILVNYEGKLTTDQVFDSNTNIRFRLSGLIAGWQLGLQHIGEGGTIILYLPPSLAYGIKGAPGIPSQAITIFSITLLEVQ